jgi:NADPH:quinone reductase-like Zn-dependent oxidoreductase
MNRSGGQRPTNRISMRTRTEQVAATGLPPAAPAAAAMQAMAPAACGPPAVLARRTIAKPTVGVSDVLVRVCAAALPAGSRFGVQVAPLPVRLASGLFRPKPGAPGVALAGVVEAVASGVAVLRPGDAVVGVGHGTCAEYESAPEARLALKPTDLSFEQAAAVPTPALAARHGLRSAGARRRGQTVPINPAAGSVGTFTVRIAKLLGADVTGVCSEPNVDRVRSLGADHGIDYSCEDFTRAGRPDDRVLDHVESRSRSERRHAVATTGILVLSKGSAGGGPRLLARLLWPPLPSPFVRPRPCRFPSKPNLRDPPLLTQLPQSAARRPASYRAFPRQETPAPLRYIEAGRARGKAVITVERGDLEQL